MPKQTRARGSGGLIKSVPERAQARHEHQHCRRSMNGHAAAGSRLRLHFSQQIMHDSVSKKF